MNDRTFVTSSSEKEKKEEGKNDPI